MKKKGMFVLSLMHLAAIKAWAALGTGSQSDIEGFADRAITFLVTVIGGAVFVGGIIFTGILLAMHKEDALKKGGYVIGGGALILLARVLWNVLRGLAGQ